MKATISWVVLASLFRCGSVCGEDAPYRDDGQTVLLLHLDGDARDAGGAENHGELRGQGTWVEGKPGKALALDGRGAVRSPDVSKSLLDDLCGVRFYMPTELFTSGPAGKPVVPGGLEVRSEPFVRSAFMSGIVGIPGDHGWTKRNAAVRRLGGTHQHSMFEMFPPSRYAKSHPEIYPVLDGQRYIPADGLAAVRHCRAMLAKARQADATDAQRKRIALFSDTFLVSQTLFEFAAAKEIPKAEVDAFRSHVEQKILPNPMTLYRTAPDASDLGKRIEDALRFATGRGKKIQGT